MKRAILALALLLGTIVVARAAEAGAMFEPCEEIRPFPGADVNLVVLPFGYQPEGFAQPKLGKGADGLSLVLQANCLMLMAQIGGVGAIHVDPHTSWSGCAPDEVFPRLMRNDDRAVRPSHGLILMWGIVHEGSDGVTLQSYIRFARRDVDERDTVQVEGEPFVLSPSGQAIALEPRTLSIKDIDALIRSSEELLKFHRAPNANSPSSSLLALARQGVPLTFQVLEVRPGWMHVRLGSEGGATGWLGLGDPSGSKTPLHLPEIDYVQIVTGYLADRCRAARGEPWRESLSRIVHHALARFLAQQDPEASPTPAAIAEQLVAIVDARGTTAYADSAARLLESAGDRLPLNALAQGNAAIGRITSELRAGNVRRARDAAERLDRSLALDPGDVVQSANAAAFYRRAEAAQGWPGAAEQRVDPDRVKQRLRRFAPHAPTGMAGDDRPR
jgi:hypothetical protein